MGSADSGSRSGSMFEPGDLIPRLISEFGYSSKEAEVTANDLVAADHRIKVPFWRWWQTGQLDRKLEVEGYSLDWLLEERAMKTPGAFVTLDLLLKDPKTVKSALNRGYDSLTIGSEAP